MCYAVCNTQGTCLLNADDKNKVESLLETLSAGSYCLTGRATGLISRKLELLNSNIHGNETHTIIDNCPRVTFGHENG